MREIREIRKDKKTVAEIYKEGATLGNNTKLLYNLIGKNIPIRNQEMANNTPLEDTIYGKDTEIIFDILSKEALLLEEFKKGTINALKRCLNTIDQLKRMASEISDPDFKAHIMEMLQTYENEIKKVMGENELQMYLQNEYEKEQDALDDILMEKYMESHTSLESEPTKPDVGFEL